MQLWVFSEFMKNLRSVDRPVVLGRYAQNYKKIDSENWKGFALKLNSLILDLIFMILKDFDGEDPRGGTLVENVELEGGRFTIDI